MKELKQEKNELEESFENEDLHDTIAMTSHFTDGEKRLETMLKGD